MPFVLDASIACNWALKDETHPVATAALARLHDDMARVPALWWFEIRNALVVNERRRRITESETRQFLDQLSKLRIDIGHIPDETGIMALARKHRLTFYDAAYLELARQEKIPLATTDSELARAARAEKAQLLGA